MDTASPQPGHLLLPLTPARNSDEVSSAPRGFSSPLSPVLAHELWVGAEAEGSGLTVEEFSGVLAALGERFNFGLPPDATPDAAGKASFLRGLRLADLALASACALGREVAWKRFLELYRAPLTQAAIAITGSATLGHELSDSLYGELYGLRTTGETGTGDEVKRRSPLSSYSGRGSLLGWLRTTVAQRHVDHHRRTRRETPLDTLDAPAPEQVAAPVPSELAKLTQAVSRTLQALGAEDRFVLAACFLDRQTLLQIARTLRVHEATVSRRIKRLTADLRKHLMEELQAGGLSERAAEEALGTDPRDLEINLRSLLQTSHGPPFLNQVDKSQVDTNQVDKSQADQDPPDQTFSRKRTEPDAPDQL